MRPTDISIRVPERVRDRLHERARRDRTTPAAAVERALDQAEEFEFWNRVREHHARLDEADRDPYVRNHTLGDHLSGPGESDVAEEDW